MIEYLEKLVADREYEKALAYAEELLLNPDQTSHDLMVINCLLLSARLSRKELHGALVAGQLAVKMAHEIEAWDYYGLACMDLGLANAWLGQYDAALEVWFTYLEKLPFYQTALKHEAVVWYNIGRAFTIRGDLRQALNALTSALKAATGPLGDPRDAHGIRQALIHAYLQSGELLSVPRLMAKCAHYLGHHTDALDLQESQLWHMKLRAEFAMLSNRARKAVSIGLNGLNRSEGMPRHQFAFHMLLAKINRSMGDTREALGHALAARVYATRARRYDFETEAAEFAYEITRSNPEVVSKVEEYYLHSHSDLAFDADTD